MIKFGISRDGLLIGVGGGDDLIYLFDSISRKVIEKIDGH